ncbi:ring-cleaving dioxygenase [Methylobacterium sp. C1]|uniref:ring-cleaving dioxygenase n=1 Tax=Methylobacterium sp. C1 TaxID=1479019 RepID=UPI0008DA0992|nr:ring-cleaving dioxygenase [Methylobacterium sp. C1]
MPVNGIHHVTAISGPARRNVDFYTTVLGLRLVKRTVNFDDPGTYHLYYGDEVGSPGTILTFFPWAGAAQGRLGVGETQETAFRVPAGSIHDWRRRFAECDVAHDPVEERFGEEVLPFRDPDGMRLALVGVAGIEADPAWTGGVAAERAIRGFHSLRLLLRDSASTGAILADVFGFAEAGSDGPARRFEADAVPGGFVDLVAEPGAEPGTPGAGSVHHVAFRAADDADALGMGRRLLEGHRIQTTDQRDRNYFRSLYFREPGGVLFEIATDIPGFLVDEPSPALGRALKLPAQYEPRREEIEAVLPDLGI